MTPFDWDIPVAKPALILGGLVLALIVGSGYLGRQVIRARAEAKILKEVSLAAQQREATAKAQATAHGAEAADWRRKCDYLQHRLDTLPRDPGPHPVAPDASADSVLAELRGLGLNPQPLGDPLALGLALGDARTTLGWGYQAQRVEPLAARLEATTALAHAQEGQVSALRYQVGSLGSALSACDDRATAETRRADLLDGALRRMGTPRYWSAGLLVGMDTEAKRHLGAYVAWSYKAVDLHAVVINNTAALGGGIRF